MTGRPGVWVNEAGLEWSESGTAPDSGLPDGVHACTVSDGRRTARLEWADASAAAVLQARLDFLEGIKGRGLPFPELRGAVQRDGIRGIVLEPWAPSVVEWWSEDPGLDRLSVTLRGLADIVDGLVRMSVGVDGVPPGWPELRLDGIARTADGRRWVLTRFGCPTGEGTAPEQVFQQTPLLPRALSSWQLGLVLFSLVLCPRGGMGRASLPTPHRTRLVQDLHRSRPRLFAHRPLDAQEFLYPDILPEPDRLAVVSAVRALLPADSPVAPVLGEAVAGLLDGLLAVDPTARAAQLSVVPRRLRSVAAQAQASIPTATPDAPPDAPAAPVAPPAAAPPPPSRGPGWGVLGAMGLVQLLTIGIAGIALLISVQAPDVAAPVPASAPAPRARRAAPARTVDRSAPEPAGSATAVDEPAPPSAIPTAKKRTVAPAPRASAPADVEDVPVDEEAPEEPGHIRVDGGTCRLVAEDGQAHSCGPLPAGRYTVWASPFGGTEIALGAHRLAPGQIMTIRCGFGTCRLR